MGRQFYEQSLAFADEAVTAFLGSQVAAAARTSRQVFADSKVVAFVILKAWIACLPGANPSQPGERVHLLQSPGVGIEFLQVGWVPPPSALELLEAFRDSQAFLNQGRDVRWELGRSFLPALSSSD